MAKQKFTPAQLDTIAGALRVAIVEYHDAAETFAKVAGHEIVHKQFLLQEEEAEALLTVIEEMEYDAVCNSGAPEYAHLRA